MWSIDDLRIPLAGRWRLRVDILISDFDKEVLEDNVAAAAHAVSVQDVPLVMPAINRPTSHEIAQIVRNCRELSTPRHALPPRRADRERCRVAGVWRTVPWTAIERTSAPSVLLVEDEPLICDIAAEALEEQGFEVCSGGDARARRCAASMSGTPIDVLFTDVNLPGGMDGAALAQAGARAAARTCRSCTRPGGAPRSSTSMPVEGSMFVAKPYNPFEIGRLLDYLRRGAEDPSHARAAGRDAASCV